jgi:hypothetical protein
MRREDKVRQLQQAPQAAVAVRSHAPLSVPVVVADVLRHSIPLIAFYAYGGSIGSYLLLTAFDLGLGLMFIVVSTRDRGDVNSVDPRSRWMIFQILSVLVATPFLGALGALIAAPIVLPVYLLGLSLGFDWPDIMSTPAFLLQIGGMALLAALRFQVLFYQRTSAGAVGQPSSRGPILGDLEGDRRRSLADYAAQVTLIATFAALCYVLILFGRFGVWALPAIYAALLVLYDVRPDLARQILPQLWQRR